MRQRGMVDNVADALSALGLDPQSNRLLTMTFPRADGPQRTVMLVNSLVAREEVSRDFHFNVEVLSNDARIPLKAMMAKMVTISLVRDDGSLRYFNGYVTEFAFVRTNGGFAFYRMVLEPWLAFAKLRRDCVSFLGRSPLEITETTFAKYQERDWKTRIYAQDGDPQLSCANQYNETDYNHLHRRWENKGLHYWYEHRADGHTLHLGDDSRLADPTDATGHAGAPGRITFRAEAGSAESDGIREWQAVRRIGSGSLTLASFDYKQPFSQLSAACSRNRQGDVFAYDLYEDTGSYGFKTLSDGENLAQRRMDEQDHLTQYFVASGNDRSAQSGRKFMLDGHFSAKPTAPAPGEAARQSIGSREYLILSALHTASNNYQAGPQAASHYKNELLCVRQSIGWRPGRHYNSEDCPCPVVLTATVVGPAGQEIYTDSLGRVKVQFHWDRLGKNDADSSAWVRVAMPVAGRHFGQSGLPRVNQEVLILFLNKNIDHPIIVSAVYNNSNPPPWDLPAELALTGWRSRELDGQRGNHLILDDSTGKLQAQLKSDHQHSQLSLGHIGRIDGDAGREDDRGEGFELRTDGHGVARAAKGLLLTTEARVGAGSHIKDMGETLQRLNAAHNQHEALAQLTQQYDIKAKQTDVATSIKTQNSAIAGQSGGVGAFPQLTAPHLVLASPAGIETTTAGSTHIASDQHTAITSGKNLSIVSGDSLFASIRQAFRLFVHQAGMRMIAAAGDIDLQALKDNINLLAKLNITHTANRITITAKEEVVINGGGSYAKFNAGGIEQGTNGNFVAHAAKHSLPGPKNMDVAITMPPQAELDGHGALNLGSHATASGRGSAGQPYKLYKNDALLERGEFDEDGNLKFKHELDSQAQYHLELPNGQRYAIEPDEQLEPHKISSAVGYHGYDNPGGSLNEDHAPQEKDRLLANPAMRNQE